MESNFEASFLYVKTKSARKLNVGVNFATSTNQKPRRQIWVWAFKFGPERWWSMHGQDEGWRKSAGGP